MAKRQRRARPAGIFRWRRRLGIFDNAAQVAEELHVRFGLSVERCWKVAMDVQRERGMDIDPRELWKECRRRVEEEKARR